MPQVPGARVRGLNAAPLRGEGQFVLYWMTAFRRGRWNYALQRAVEWCRELKKPLVVLEPLRCGYRWASDRLHRFVLQGMADNRAHFARTPATYLPYVEPAAGAGGGLLASLAARACVVVADDYPCFFLPRMVAAAAAGLPIKLEAVDSNGLFPLRATEQTFTTAHSFRRFLQKQLPHQLADAPLDNPLARVKLPRLATLPAEIATRWPAASDKQLRGGAADLTALPIDHAVGPAAFDGGPQAAERTLRAFIDKRLANYGQGRNHPDDDVASGLSPYLHFGHVSAHEVFDRIAHRQGWTLDQLGKKPTGSREGWWGMSVEAEGFLDELVTWREVGFNLCSHRDDYDQYESLPDWARKTLEKHASDPRRYVYSLSQFESSATHDAVWNAAQNQLRREGRMHNYLRMLWGKKILEWTAGPREALEVLIELNNKYAVDGRDPNSYSGIFWVLGRYDRAWGPERPIFGKVRYMSSENTRKKLRMTEYLRQYA